jgi:hypothetical protein
MLKQLPEVKRKHFADEAKALDAPHMKQMSALKRYTLAVALLDAQYAQTLDDLAEMFIRQMQQMHYRGKQALAVLRQDTQARTDDLIATLREIVCLLPISLESPNSKGFQTTTQFSLIPGY